jgi:hypothetical protein
MIGLSPEQRSLERAITTEGQLLVEGRVPEMFFREMIKACGLTATIEARTFGDIGKENLQAYLEVFTQKAVFKERVKRIGIIRDAEGSAAVGAFQSVQAALQGAQLPVPTAMNKLEGGSLAVGVFILPNCQDAGMLESLCLSAAAEMEKAQSGGVLPCVYEFLTCLSKRGYQPTNPTKAQFAGYALARDVIDPQLGRAAQQSVIPWEAKAFEPLKAFLKSIAGA